MRGFALMLAGALIGFTIPLLGGMTSKSWLEAWLLALFFAFFGRVIGGLWDEMADRRDGEDVG